MPTENARRSGDERGQPQEWSAETPSPLSAGADSQGYGWKCARSVPANVGFRKVEIRTANCWSTAGRALKAQPSRARSDLGRDPAGVDDPRHPADEAEQHNGGNAPLSQSDLVRPLRPLWTYVVDEANIDRTAECGDKSLRIPSGWPPTGSDRADGRTRQDHPR